MANISMDAINIINSKLGQANAISILLILGCDAEEQLNNGLRNYVLSAISDLISDSKDLLNDEIERKGANNERV